MSEEVKKDEDWMQKKWRPAMGWMYMIVCMMDMVIFPVLWSMVQVMTKQPVTQWNPLTLQGAGLFHLAMGAVLGIAACGRTQEKMAGAAAGNGTPSLPSFSAPTTPAPSFSAPVVSSPVVSTPAPSFGDSAPAPSFGAPVTPGFGGKPAPVQPPFPER
jgi:hypothetical protein